METNGKLTTRQWRLHDYIKSQSGRKVTKRDIYESVAGYEWHERASDKCPSIRTDKVNIFFTILGKISFTNVG